MISTIVKTVLLLCTLVATSGVFAQSVIQRSPTPYIERPDGQIAVGGTQAVAPVQAAGLPAQPVVWEVLLSDGNLYKALSRWARFDGRPVHWEATKEFPAVYASYKGTYVQAFEQVMKDTANGSYKLHACEHDNLIRVLHTSQSCFH